MGRFEKFMLGKLVDFSVKWMDGVPLVQLLSTKATNGWEE